MAVRVQLGWQQLCAVGFRILSVALSAVCLLDDDDGELRVILKDNGK
jgi:hypothetical protein